MGLRVVFVSGLAKSGKTTVAQAIASSSTKKPHYVRLVLRDEKEHRLQRIAGDLFESQEGLLIDDERVFEALPEYLSAIHKIDRYGIVIIEADPDPGLRCAYPYDHRVFTMMLPKSSDEVFREPRVAARELKRVLDDTDAFASEIFGLFGEESEDATVVFEGIEIAKGNRERRYDLSSSILGGALYSPLGDELASRITLHQQYHGLVESDLVIVNRSDGYMGGSATDECIKRIKRLLTRIGKSRLIECNPAELSVSMPSELVRMGRPGT